MVRLGKVKWNFEKCGREFKKLWDLFVYARGASDLVQPIYVKIYLRPFLERRRVKIIFICG